MKMIYAGLVGANSVAENWLYNCTRNTSCQRAYYIPITSFDDFILYFDFPGKPTAYTINIKSCTGDTIDTTGLICNFVIAQKPDNSWYGVFTQFDSSTFPALTKFYVDAVFIIGGNEYQYFSNQFEFDPCAAITKIESCYNDSEIGSDAVDCNNVYYGFHSGSDLPIGNIALRYYHHAYVRYAEVIETSNKIQLTLFNNLTTYKNFFTREYIFQCELVPGFYKDVLIGVFNRGTVGIDGIEYNLADAQEISITNDSLKFWKVDIKLTSLCKQYFSCAVTTCVPVLADCINDLTTAEFVTDHIHLSGGTINAGDSISWFLYENNILVDSGESEDYDIFFAVTVDTEANCYEFQWYKNCACGNNSESGAVVNFRYGYADIPFGDGTGGTIDKTTFNYQYTGILLPGEDLVTKFVGMPVNQYIAIQYPATESDKTTWQNTTSNYGTVPDSIMRAVVIVNDKKYILSRVAMTLDNSYTTVFSNGM